MMENERNVLEKIKGRLSNTSETHKASGVNKELRGGVYIGIHKKRQK